MSRFDWEKIRAEYEAGASQNELSKRHGCSRGAVQKHITAEGWSQDVRPVAAYAIAIFKDGYREREVMTVEDIEKVRAVSAAQNGPWKTWWDQMAIKTVTKRLAKRLPVSREVVDVLDADREEFEGATYDVTASPIDTSEFDRLAQARGANMGAWARFTVATASMNQCPVDDVKSQAIANFDSFWAAFETWQTKQPAANGNGQKKPRATTSLREGAAKAIVEAGLDLATIEKDFGAYSKDWSYSQCEQAKKMAADALADAGVVPDPEAEADHTAPEQPADAPQGLPETVECPKTGNVVRTAVECAACDQNGLCPSTDGKNA